MKHKQRSTDERPVAGDLQVRIVHLGDGGLRVGEPTDDAPAGTFEGILSRSGVGDSYGTRWSPFAWTRGGLDAEVYALTHMHSPFDALGVFRAQEVPDPDREGESLLTCVGSWDDTAAGRDGYARALSGSAAEMSVGFSSWIESDEDPNLFEATKLREGAQVTARFAAQPGAALAAVRMGASPVAMEAMVEAVLSRLAAARTDVSTPERVVYELAQRQQIIAARLRLETAEA